MASQYATTTDLTDFGLPSGALVNITSGQQNTFLTKASGVVDSYLRAQHTLPLGSPFPDEIIRCTVIIAAYDILTFRGYNPDEFDEGWRQRYLDCLEWLAKLARGEISLDDGADATPNINEGAPKVQTGGADIIFGVGTIGETRGW